MRPVNKKVVILTAYQIEYQYDVEGIILQDFINLTLQTHYDMGWDLRYMKHLDNGDVSLLFTHAPFREEADGDDD